MVPWNLDLSRAGVVNLRDAYGDDDKAGTINGLRPTPPSAMRLIRPSGPACVQNKYVFQYAPTPGVLRQFNLAIWFVTVPS